MPINASQCVAALIVRGKDNPLRAW